MSGKVRLPAVQRTAVARSAAGRNDAIANLAEAFGLARKDKLKLTISDGFVAAHIKRPDGQVVSHKSNVDSGFRQMTVVGGSSGPTARREIVKELRKEGKSQAAIANLLGVSQATVSLDLKTLRMR